MRHVFVTSQGSPYARFKRALASGNLTQVRAVPASAGSDKGTAGRSAGTI